MIIDIIGDCLQQLGYRILVARSENEAVDTFKNHMEQIDLVLLDMILPGMSGGKTYDRLKEINPAVKALVATRYSLNGKAADISARGCNGFIQKPANIHELSKRLRETLGKK